MTGAVSPVPEATRELGTVAGANGETIAVGVQHGEVGVYMGCWLSADGVTLDAGQQAEFAVLFARAVAEAGETGEWEGEPHTLIVHSARLPDGPLDNGDLEYDLEHPPSCEKEEVRQGNHSYIRYTCDVARHEDDGLPFSLRYSGTPITEPGTYRIQGWGRKIYHFELGYEYAGGVSVIDPGKAA
jgi:hypothetical protein